MDKFKRKLRGFTLLEIIVVIAILAVLTAIVVPNINGIMRTNKILAANEQAQNVYMAAQEFLISEQIRGVKPEHIADDLSKGLCWIAVRTDIGAGSYADGNKTVINDNFNVNLSYINDGSPSPTKFPFADGVESRLDKGFKGSWVVAFYPQTFTVAYAVYNDNYTSAADSDAAVKLIGTNNGVKNKTNCDNRLYFDVFEGSSSTKKGQESDIRHADASEAGHMYTGQFPIPGPVF